MVPTIVIASGVIPVRTRAAPRGASIRLSAGRACRLSIVSLPGAGVRIVTAMGACPGHPRDGRVGGHHTGPLTHLREQTWRTSRAEGPRLPAGHQWPTNPATY